MKSRTVPGTDLEVSVVCQGTMRFAEKAPGSDGRSQAGERAMCRAIDKLRSEGKVGDYERLERLTKTFKDNIGDSLTGFAIRFHFAAPVIPSVAVSLNTEKQVDEICDAVDKPFPDESVLDKALEIWRSG